MSSDRPDQATKIFEQALDLPEEERGEWVREACGGDARLLSEVEHLFELLGQASGMFRSVASEKQDADAGKRLGDFLIKEQIGAGGMGIVYRAEQSSLNRQVALKVLPPHLRVSTEAQTRFTREIEAAARLQHSAIVSVHSSGSQDDTLYYAMDLIDGQPLSLLIQSMKVTPIVELEPCLALMSTDAESDTHPRTPVTGSEDATEPSGHIDDFSSSGSLTLPTPPGETYFDTVARLVADVADGLQYAHERSVVHRDIKPSNLLLAKDGTIHISDFGLARILEEPGVTATGQVIGTPFYMAPEQISADGVIDGRTDVYALGATLYELLTLSPPFPGANREAVLSRILNEEPTPPRSRNRRVPRDLGTICLKALEKKPSRRYASAGDFRDDLKRFLRREPIRARRTGPLGRGMKWVERNRPVAAMVAVVSLAVTLVGPPLYRRLEQQRSDLNTVELSRESANARLREEQAENDRLKQEQLEELFERAMLSGMAGNSEDAEDAIAQCQTLGAEEAQLNLMKGTLAFQFGRFGSANAFVEQAVEAMPESVAALCMLGDILRSRGRNAESRRLLGQAQALPAESIADLIFRGMLEVTHDPEQSLKTLEDAIAMRRESIVARLAHSSAATALALQNGDSKYADMGLRDLEAVANFSEENSLLLSRFMEAHLAASTIHQWNENDQRTAEHLDRAADFSDRLAKYEGDFLAIRSRAFYFDHVGDDDQAIDRWRQIEKKTVSFLVLALLRNYRFEEAVAVCERARDRTSSDIEELWYPFVLASTANSPDAIASEFRVDRLPDQSSAILVTYALGCLCGDPEQRREWMRQSFGSDVVADGDVTIQFALGELDEDALLEEGTGFGQDRCIVRFFAGMARLEQGDRDGAIIHLRDAAQQRQYRLYVHHLARFVLAMLERDAYWPPWIE